MSQFVKAVLAGCITEEEELGEVLSAEQLLAQFKDPSFEKAVNSGWNWKCVASAVEAACHWFPAFLQASLNSSNHIAGQVTEMELAMSIALHYSRTQNLEQAVLACQAYSPLNYLETVGHFVAVYGGGVEFPLVKFLAAIETCFGSAMLLGEEFFTSVVKTDFGSKDTSYPMVRASLLAAGLSSHKKKDGVSRLLVRCDVDKLKSHANKEKMLAVEHLLKMTFQDMEKSPKGLLHQDSVKLLGRFMIRCALMLVKKEGKGFESKVYGKVSDIHEAFIKEEAAIEKKDTAQASAAAPAEDAGEEKIWRLQENSDAKTLAEMQHSWLKKDKVYQRKDKLYVFVKFTKASGVFAELDLLGNRKQVEVPHKDLKHFRKTDKKPPSQVPADVVAKLQMEKSEQWKLELEKAEVQAGVLQHYMERSIIDLSLLAFTSNKLVMAQKPIKKNALRIVPFGTVSLLKLAQNIQNKLDTAKLVEHKNGHQYQLVPSKVDFIKGTGAVPIYFWVLPTENEEEANLELVESQKYKGWLTIPYLRPKDQIEAGAVLKYYKAAEADDAAEGRKAKRQKKKL
jgi:hypothetical protein